MDIFATPALIVLTGHKWKSITNLVCFQYFCFLVSNSVSAVVVVQQKDVPSLVDSTAYFWTMLM